ncbi:MAG: Asp-tRNA(Asn)/Glu-tRNA(Gln) amidotransferase subunit GatB [Endomicrobiia bacterium]
MKKVIEYKNKSFLPVIGLEVHVQLNTKTKMFCSCAVEFGAEANKNICPVCTGQPGVLPVLNKTAIDMAIKTALALNCKIHKESIFARKNYYYPDLPKNYQISQYEQPLATDGYIETSSSSEKEKVLIKRIHLEEDAGKLLHSIGKEELDYSLVDYNRTGTPLMEIVTEPCLFSVDDAIEYLLSLRNILRYIGVSDCDMEKGTFRCDANVSVTQDFSGDKIKLGTKTELKNMNSFKAIKDALNYEILRHIEKLYLGENIVQETRMWNEGRGITESMRSKEEAHDYRYFPEPDLLPLKISDDWISEINKTIPELPNKKKERFIKEYGLSDYDANVLVSDKDLAEYFDNTVVEIQKFNIKQNIKIVAKNVCNVITTELLGKLNSDNKTIKENPLSCKHIAELVFLLLNETISSKILKEVFAEMWLTNEFPSKIVEKKGLTQITSTIELEKLVDEVIKENEKIVLDYKNGKQQAIGSLIGSAMKKSGGRANPRLLTEIFKQKLSS